MLLHRTAGYPLIMYTIYCICIVDVRKCRPGLAKRIHSNPSVYVYISVCIIFYIVDVFVGWYMWDKTVLGADILWSFHRSQPLFRLKWLLTENNRAVQEMEIGQTFCCCCFTSSFPVEFQHQDCGQLRWVFPMLAGNRCTGCSRTPLSTKADSNP